MKDFLGKISIGSNDLVFISIPDYHWALTDFKYLKAGHVFGLEKSLETLKIISSEIELEKMEDIVVFSEHGFKFRNEIKQGKDHFLNKDRTNIFFFHKNKKCNSYVQETNLVGLDDIGTTLLRYLEQKNSLELSFSKIFRQEILIEDYDNITPNISSLPSLWALVTLDGLYQRSKEDGIFFKMTNEIERIYAAALRY